VSPSSKQWLARHFDDPYVRRRLSHPANYRSRSAFKLLEIDDRYRRFLRAPDVRAVVDLGAAPGGWSQVVAGFMGWQGETSGYDARARRRTDKRGGDGRWGLQAGAQSELWSDGTENVEEEIESGSGGRGVVVAVDRLRIVPIPGVHTLQADFLVPETALMLEAIIRAKANPDGKADVILSDMAANATGNRTRDTQDSLDICHAVWDFTTKHLRTAQASGVGQVGSYCSNISTIPSYKNFVPFISTQAFTTSCISNPNPAGLPQGRVIGCVSASKVSRRQLRDIYYAERIETCCTSPI